MENNESSNHFRPQVPPKPKSDNNNSERSPQTRSTVGARVNLATAKKFSRTTQVPSNAQLNPSCRASETPFSQKPKKEDLDVSRHSISPKPALPPKPGPFSGNRRIVQNDLSSGQEPNSNGQGVKSQISKVEGVLRTQMKSSDPISSRPVPTAQKNEMKQSGLAPVASIDELEGLSDLSSPSPGSKTQLPSKFPMNRTQFFYPQPLHQIHAPVKGREVERKSSSLGRNLTLSALASNLKKSMPSFPRSVAPLDLRSSIPIFTPPLGAPPAPPLRKKRLSNPSIESCHPPPVYAVLDKDKKWEERRLKAERTSDEDDGNYEKIDEIGIKVQALELAQIEHKLANPIEHKIANQNEPSESKEIQWEVQMEELEKEGEIGNSSLENSLEVEMNLPSNSSFLFTGTPEKEDGKIFSQIDVESALGQFILASPKVDQIDPPSLLQDLDVSTLENLEDLKTGSPQKPCDISQQPDESFEEKSPLFIDEGPPLSARDPGKFLLDVDIQIQTVKSLLSEHQSEQTSLSRDSFRRRSWNCSDYSPSPSESSSSSSIRIEHRFAPSLVNRSSWIDEGEISTGALGDAENSDAPIPSSNEDFGQMRAQKPETLSRRKRIANTIFGSLGKGANKPGGRRIKGRATTSDLFISKPRKEPIGSPQVGEEEIPIPPQRTSSLGLPQIPVGTSGKEEAQTSYSQILDDLSPRDKKAFYVAREILTSERTFVNVLNLLTVDFPNWLNKCGEAFGAPCIPEKDLDIILGGLPHQKKINEELLRDLELRIVGWKSNPKVSDIIVQMGHFLKIYSVYIKDLDKIRSHFDECIYKYPRFKYAVSEFENSDICQKLGLKHYMLKPVQRMPQYRLLLEDYLKCLDESSVDYQDTRLAIDVVKGVAEHADEATGLRENAEKFHQLQSRLSSDIMQSGRRLIKDGELQKICRKDRQPRYFALMSDALLCMIYNPTTGSNKDLKLRYTLQLSGMRIGNTENEDYKNEFTVVSITKSFTLVAKTPREKEQWVDALNRAIKKNIERLKNDAPAEYFPNPGAQFQLGIEAPIWIQDSRVTMCQICTAEFNFTFRRHHCRGCGKVVCGPCSGNQAPLRYLELKADRVCDDCYQILLEDFDRENQSKNSKSVEDLRALFKKMTPNVPSRGAKKRLIPTRLEVPANSSGSQMSGYLLWREKKSAREKRDWIVLMDRILYIYAASEDIRALKSIPILGYKVESAEEPGVENEESTIFKLTHNNQSPMYFQADKYQTAEKWMAAMNEATTWESGASLSQTSTIDLPEEESQDPTI